MKHLYDSLRPCAKDIPVVDKNEFYTQCATMNATRIAHIHSLQVKCSLLLVLSVALFCRNDLSAATPQPGPPPIPLASRFEPEMKPLGGTWTNAQGKAVLIVTDDHICWLLNGGQWMLGSANLTFEECLELSSGDSHDILFRPAPWMARKLQAVGFQVDGSKWYFGKKPVLLEPGLAGKRLLDERSAAEIDLSEVGKASEDALRGGVSFSVADYVGIWRVKGRVYDGDKRSGNEGGNEDETLGGAFFRIDADGGGSVFYVEDGKSVSGGALRWTVEMEGIRCMDADEESHHSNEAVDAYTMWYDAQTKTILVNRWYHWWRMERAKDVEDPADALREMMRSRSYRGCWGGGEMFGQFTVAFDPDGNGFSSAFMWAAPFVWAADTNGNIKMTIPLPYGETTNAIAHYDAATDTMHLQELGKAKRNREFDLEHPEYPARDMLDALTNLFSETNVEMEKKMARYQAQHHLMFTNESARMHFDDLASALSWLKAPGDSNCVSRKIVFESISPDWSDSITYNPRSGFSASLGTGYFERGKRPPEAELAAMAWKQTQRPSNLPPPQVENLNGIDDLDRTCAKYEKAYFSRMSFQRSTFWWYSCVDIARVVFTDGDAKDFAEALRPRFDPLFPRDAETAITRIRRADGK